MSSKSKVAELTALQRTSRPVSSSWNFDRTPALEELLLRVVAWRFSPTEFTIVKTLLYYESMTEEELKATLKMDIQVLRISVQRLAKAKIVQTRVPGDVNDYGVGKDHIFINFSIQRNNIAYILDTIRAKVVQEEKNVMKQRKWTPVNSYLKCDNPFCSQQRVSILHIHQHSCPTNDMYQRFVLKCAHCWNPMQVISEPHPTTMTVERFNELFGDIYKLLHAVDSAYQQMIPTSAPTRIAPGISGSNFENLEVRVRFVKDDDKEQPLTPKTPIPWFSN